MKINGLRACVTQGTGRQLRPLTDWLQPAFVIQVYQDTATPTDSFIPVALTLQWQSWGVGTETAFGLQSPEYLLSVPLHWRPLDRGG